MFFDLVHAIGTALPNPVNIAFIDMPESIRTNYQHFTVAQMSKLRNAGYSRGSYSLEDSVADYVREYLMRHDIRR